MRAVVGNADDVAGVRLVGGLALLGEEEDRRVDRDARFSRTLNSFMPRRKCPEHRRMNAIAVAMVRVHVGLHLEDEARDALLGRVDGALLGLARQRPGAHAPSASSSSSTPKLRSALPKNTGDSALRGRPAGRTWAARCRQAPTLPATGRAMSRIDARRDRLHPGQLRAAVRPNDRWPAVLAAAGACPARRGSPGTSHPCRSARSAA